MTEEKSIINQECLLAALIYYIIGTGMEENTETILNLLEYDKNDIENIMKKMPLTHPTNIYFKKISKLNYGDFEIILKELRKKVKQEKKIQNTIPEVTNDVEAKLYVKKIVSNDTSKSYEDYIEKLKKNNNPEACAVYGNRLCYIEKNIDLAIEYLNKEYEKENYWASLFLGEIYYKLTFWNKAEQYFCTFLEKEGQISEYIGIIANTKKNLINMYFTGENGIEKDYKKVIRIFKTLDESYYDKDILYNIGYIYFNGNGEEKKEKLGFYYLKKSAEQGNSIAQFMVAMAYINGQGVDGNRNEGQAWFEKAQINSSYYTKYLVGMIYYKGEEKLNIKKNKAYAYELIKQAAISGIKEAKLELEKIKNEQIIYNEDLDENERKKKENTWFEE